MLIISMIMICINVYAGEYVRSINKNIAGKTVKVNYFFIDKINHARITGNKASEIQTWVSENMHFSRLPTSASVREMMSPVRHQGERGTCSIFAAVALLESYAYRANLDLSEQCVAKFSSGRDPGHIAQRISWVLKHGIYLEDHCPYDEQHRNNIPSLHEDAPISFAVHAEILPVTTFKSLNVMKARLAKNHPVGISIWIVTDEFYHDEDTVIRLPEVGKNLCRNSYICACHSVVATGFDDATETIEFKNSWGTSWKNLGYGRMTYRYFLSNYVEGLNNRMVVVH